MKAGLQLIKEAKGASRPDYCHKARACFTCQDCGAEGHHVPVWRTLHAAPATQL